MEHKRIPTTAIDAFNRHDAAGIAAVYAENATLADPISDEPLKGRNAIQQDFREFFNAFPDASIELTNVIADDHAVAYEVIFKGTNTGELITPQGALSPTSRGIEVRACHFMRVNNDGLVEADRRYYDVASFMGQLGLTEQ